MSAVFTITIDGKQVAVDEKDIWTKSGVGKPIIRHDGVRRLMLKAGVKVERLDLVITPTTDNGMRTAFLAVGTNADGRRAFAIGEADSANLQPNSVAEKFPTVMAAKRAVDRMALDLLGLFELYSEIELAPNGENGTEPASPNSGDTGSAPPETRKPDTDAPGSSNGSGHAHGNGHSNGNGSFPPTAKQVAYIRELAERQGLTTEQAEMLLRSVRTRSAASGLIQQMKLAA
jgi:hypothetical protein